MSRILYLECYSGISGDMTVGALLDLGANQEVLKKALASLNLDGYHVHFGRTKKCGIDAFDFDVHMEKQIHNHSHNHNEHNACHEHFSHHHEHRNIDDIYEIIDRLEASEPVKALSKRMFDILAKAEAKAHGLPIKEVHFHEVGAIDSIVDILSVAVCIDNLGVDKVIISPLSEGQGFVQCQHGIMPVPVPATVNIVSEYSLQLKITDNEGEMVTPTGAAIAAALDSGRKLPDNYTIKKIGLGAGKKDFKNANILRAMIIEDISQKENENRIEEIPESLWQLETNIDDCSGEALGFTLECLFEAGAVDVWYTSIYMKKSRPSYSLQVLCKANQVEIMQDIIFAHTTTLGIRKKQVERTVLTRVIKQIKTPYGNVSVKRCKHKESIYFYPEFEDIKRICLEQQKKYKDVYHEIIEICKNHKDFSI